MQLIKIKCKEKAFVDKNDRILYFLPYRGNVCPNTFLELFDYPYFPLEYDIKQELICLRIKDIIFDSREVLLVLYNAKLYYFYLIPEEHEIQSIK